MVNRTVLSIVSNILMELYFYMVLLFYKILSDLSWVRYEKWVRELKMHGIFLEQFVRKYEGND